MVRLRDSWRFNLSSAPTVGNPCRPLQPESVLQTDMRAVRPLRAQVQEVPEHKDRDQVARIAEQMRIETGFGDDDLRIGADVLQDTIEFLCDAQVDEAAGSRAFRPILIDQGPISWRRRWYFGWRIHDELSFCSCPHANVAPGDARRPTLLGPRS